MYKNEAIEIAKQTGQGIRRTSFNNNNCLYWCLYRKGFVGSWMADRNKYPMSMGGYRDSYWEVVPRPKNAPPVHEAYSVPAGEHHHNFGSRGASSIIVGDIVEYVGKSVAGEFTKGRRYLVSEIDSKEYVCVSKDDSGEGNGYNSKYFKLHHSTPAREHSVVKGDISERDAFKIWNKPEDKESSVAMKNVLLIEQVEHGEYNTVLNMLKGIITLERDDIDDWCRAWREYSSIALWVTIDTIVGKAWISWNPYKGGARVPEEDFPWEFANVDDFDCELESVRRDATEIRQSIMEKLVANKTNETEKTTMKKAAIKVVEANKQAAIIAAKIEVGGVVTAQVKKAVVKKLPKLVQLYADNPLFDIVLANVMAMAIQNFAPNNEKAVMVADALVQSAMVKLAQSFNINEIIDEALKGIDISSLTGGNKEQEKAAD